ncbi:MAG: presenilin [Crenarchaeota archaeon]|nr:presenilin [Thermoproteota archaeon]
MSSDIEKLSLALPMLIFPIERKQKKVLTVVGILTISSVTFAIFTSSILKYFLQLEISESAAPVGESELGAFAAVLNLLYFLLIVVLITFLLVFLVKRGKIILLRNILVVLMSYIIFIMTLNMSFVIGAYALANVAGFSEFDPATITYLIMLSVLLSAVSTMIYIISCVRRTLLQLRNIILVLTASWVGVWLSWSLGELTPIVLLLGFALYDLYSVLRGPLKELAKSLRQDIVESEYEPKFGSAMGLGDIFFYSFAVGYSFAVLSPLETLIICIMIILGVVITEVLLFKLEAEALPALPIPILSAVALIVLFKYLI